MSRIGKKPIAIPKGVKVDVKPGTVEIQGPKGKLQQALPPGIGFKIEGDQLSASTLRLFLKYGPRGERIITGIERVSRPGRRVYFGSNEVPDVLAGLGTSILTTSRGVMTGREAVKAGVGGEVLCNVW